MLKILIADNCALMRSTLRDIINADKAFHVIDMCLNGEDAYSKIKRTEFDLVVMEMDLPGMSGLQVLEKLQADGDKTKVVAISTATREEAKETMRALELGAYDFVARPAQIHETSECFARNLLEAMHGAADAVPKHVAPRGVVPKAVAIQRVAPATEPKLSLRPSKKFGKPDIVALACSTGGPRALHMLLPMLPKDFALPIVMVQHMPEGFTEALAERLNEKCAIEVKEACDGELIRAGCVYIAPGGRHMEITENNNKQACVCISDTPPVNSLRPCADLMYKSLAKTSYQNILCVVLTGMGSDGTQGIMELQKHKNVYVISESKKTCAVYGMPKSIEKNELADETLPIHRISDAIIKKMGDE